MIVEYKGDKIRVNYIDEGLGEVIVLLHGWGARASIYRSIINVLNSSFRVIAPDLPGFGDTTEPSFAYSAEDYADFIIEFLNVLGVKKAHFIGHSHGGRTVIEIASRSDCQIGIGKIVLLDSAGIPAKATFKKTLRIKTFKFLKKIVLTSVIRKAFPDALDKLQRKFGSTDYSSSSPIMRQSMVKVLNTDYTQRLCNIKSSTLLIWGENDTATPLTDAKLMEKEIQDSGLVVIQGGGHFAFAENPHLTKRVLESFFNIKQGDENGIG